jgi:XTP/dITP diphosphohydrolase
MSSLAELVAVMDRLRSPGGCSWDAEQTHSSLAKYLLEETYETLDALASGDLTDLHEELGDLLLQIVFHARIAQESDPAFTLESIAAGVVEKLIRRHPHVFAGVDLSTQEALEANWKRVKAEEKSRESSTDGVPLAMPALALAQALIYRTKDTGLPVASANAIVLAREFAAQSDDLGELLAALAVVAQERGQEAESLLRDYMAGYRQEVRRSEGIG